MVILNFLAAARTGRVRNLGEQENWGEAFQKTDTYTNLALGQMYKNIFIGFLVQMKTLKFAFKINWPLAFISKLIFWSTLAC